MREVKYRGLDVMTGQWLYGNLLITGTGLVYIVTQNLIGDLPFWQVDKGTVGQFTGLKDKNGVEIYEGDIVRYITHSKEYLLVVKWNTLDACFDFGWVRTNYAINGEVIGNNYQHSELLEVQHDSK